MHDHRTAQGDGEEHAQAAAAGRDEQRLPELKALPVADHQHTRNDEDDGGQCPRCRRLRLHHVVLEDVRVFSHLQHGHRDDGGRDSRGEGQTDLQSEVDVGRREDNRQQSAQQHTANGELRQTQFVLHELIFFCFHTTITPSSERGLG